MPVHFKNTLLRAFDEDTIFRLALRPVVFPLLHTFEEPGYSIEHLSFLEEGMTSMTTTFSDGSQVEVGMFGYESVIGVSGLMGTRSSLNRVYTQIPGRGYVCKLAAARREFARGEMFQMLTLRYVQVQLLQAMQSAGCNAKHNIEQRLARWLLLCADRTHLANFDLSHEFLGSMLGAGRPAVTMAAKGLKDRGLISYKRSHITILDFNALEAISCECYRTIKDHLDNLTRFDTSFVA
jgi:CRP-like cAMP-binding protein